MEKRDSPELVFDDEVRTVFEFMLANMPTAKLVAVANSIAQIAPVLLGGTIPKRKCGRLLGSGLRFRFVIRVHNQAPANASLIQRMLVVRLRRKWVALCRNRFSAASITPIYSRSGSSGCRVIDAIEDCVLGWTDKLRIFVEGHNCFLSIGRIGCCTCIIP